MTGHNLWVLYQPVWLWVKFNSFSLSVLTAIFPGEPALAGFTGAKDNGSGSDKWSYKTGKAPVKMSPPTN